jgi:phage terminase small subunit
MAARAPLSVTVVSQALKQCFGNMAAASRSLGIDRTTIFRFVKKHSDLIECVETMRETMLDNAETALNKAILAGESWAVCFFLKTQGRRRGYTTSTGSMVHPILAEVRQAESDLATVLGQLCLTPRSRSASRLTGEDMQQEIVADNSMSAKLLKLMP